MGNKNSQFSAVLQCLPVQTRTRGTLVEKTSTAALCGILPESSGTDDSTRSVSPRTPWTEVLPPVSISSASKSVQLQPSSRSFGSEWQIRTKGLEHRHPLFLLRGRCHLLSRSTERSSLLNYCYAEAQTQSQGCPLPNGLLSPVRNGFRDKRPLRSL